MYQIVIETKHAHFKIIKTDSYQQAQRIYCKALNFAKNHNITFVVSLFEIGGMCGRVLLESEVINPTAVIKLN